MKVETISARSGGNMLKWVWVEMAIFLGSSVQFNSFMFLTRKDVKTELNQ